MANLEKIVSDLLSGKIQIEFIQNPEFYCNPNNVKKLSETIQITKDLKKFYLNSVPLENKSNLALEYINSMANSPSLSTISDITLYNCFITDDCGEALVSIIGPLISGFNILGNKFGTKFSIAFSKKMSQMSSLISYLHLESNLFDDEAAQNLAEGFKKMENLVHLNLKKNLITDLGVGAISKALACTLKINHLDLSFNKITVKGVQSVAALIGEAPLKNIDFSGNPIGDEGVYVLADASEKMLSMTTLHLNSCNISPDGIVVFCKKAIEGCGRLFSISLNKNQFDTKAAKALGDAMAVNCSIMFMDTEAANLTAPVIGYICEGLKKNTYCRRWSLNENKLEAEAMSYLSDLLLQTNAKELNIPMNKCGITNDAIVHFLPCLATNSALTELCIRENKLVGPGIEMIFQALKKNTNVKKVEANQNSFNQRGALALIDYLYENNSFKTFYTYSSDIPPALEKKIEAMIANNVKGIKNEPPSDHQAIAPVQLPPPLSKTLPEVQSTPSIPHQAPSTPQASSSAPRAENNKKALLRLEKLEAFVEQQGEENKKLKEENIQFKKRLTDVEEKNNQFLKRLTDVEEENILFKKRLTDVEEENNELKKKLTDIEKNTNTQPSLGFGGPAGIYMEYIQ